jgi:hypothetical protein
LERINDISEFRPNGEVLFKTQVGVDYAAAAVPIELGRRRLEGNRNQGRSRYGEFKRVRESSTDEKNGGKKQDFFYGDRHGNPLHYCIYWRISAYLRAVVLFYVFGLFFSGVLTR